MYTSSAVRTEFGRAMTNSANTIRTTRSRRLAEDWQVMAKSSQTRKADATVANARKSKVKPKRPATRRSPGVEQYDFEAHLPEEWRLLESVQIGKRSWLCAVRDWGSQTYGLVMFSGGGKSKKRGPVMAIDMEFDNEAVSGFFDHFAYGDYDLARLNLPNWSDAPRVGPPTGDDVILPEPAPKPYRLPRQNYGDDT